MKHCKSCGYPIEDETLSCCPACNASLAEKKKTAAQEAEEAKAQAKKPSIVLKYKDFIDNESLYKIALMKQGGLGTAKNEEEALEIFQVLAYRGHCPSILALSDIYLSQTPPNRELAKNWLRIGVEAGDKPCIIRYKALGFEAEDKEEERKRQEEQRRIEEEEKRNTASDFRTIDSQFTHLVQEALPYIVRIHVYYQEDGQMQGSAGSGFITHDGYVVTNAHVTGSDPAYIQGFFDPSVDDKPYNLYPLIIVPEYDVAILRFMGGIESKFAGKRNLPMRFEKTTYGETVYTIGNPLDLGISVCKGIVSSPEREWPYPEKVESVIQVDFTANHGNSGGACLDLNNNVIGLVTFSPKASEGGITMCVPTAYAEGLIRFIEEQMKEKK